ncbi:hypothetical protein BH09ACT4_BH09ACT4_06200 [soil metagenome]
MASASAVASPGTVIEAVTAQVSVARGISILAMTGINVAVLGFIALALLVSGGAMRLRRRRAHEI